VEEEEVTKDHPVLPNSEKVVKNTNGSSVKLTHTKQETAETWSERKRQEMRPKHKLKIKILGISKMCFEVLPRHHSFFNLSLFFKNTSGVYKE
jgi:hypothetical protein